MSDVVYLTPRRAGISLSHPLARVFLADELELGTMAAWSLSVEGGALERNVGSRVLSSIWRLMIAERRAELRRLEPAQLELEL